MTQLKAMILVAVLIYSASLTIMFGLPGASVRYGINGEIIFVISTLLLFISSFFIGRMMGASDEAQKKREWASAKIEELLVERDAARYELRVLRSMVDSDRE